MQRITGLPDEQVLAYEAQAEAALRAALEAVMDKIAWRIEAHAPAALLASVLVAAPGDQGDIIPPEDVPAGDGLPPGQPYVSPDDLASIPPLWQEAVAQQVLPIVAQVFLDAVGRTYAGMVEASSIAGLPSVGSLAAEQYLARAQNTFEKVGDALWATARTELSDGFERGESIPQLAERLRASAGVTARTGVLVARTQVNEASNAGSFAVAQASGLAMQKEWIATPDLRTRPEHLAADGQRVDLNEPFMVGGYSAMYPAAPTLPPSMRFNCRCTIGYVMPDRAPAQVRHDNLQTQELADLPGTTTVDDLAAAQSARLQQIIDEQHAAVEGVVQDVHQQFRDRFGKAGGPGLGDLGPEAVVDPRAIRAAYRQAGTLDDLRTAWQDEMRRITSRDIIVQLPPGASVLTMRQYAEGVTQMLERFPEARLRKISWWSDGTTSDYARIARGSATIEFNAYWAADIHRAEYLRALRSDVKGWTGPERSGWSVRGASTPQATAYHEFAHILDIETLGDGAAARALDIVSRRAVVRGVADDELIASDVSAYATSNGNELIAEAMTDVMVNGQRASAASREIYDLIVADYKARGLAVRTTTHAADELTGEVLPKAAAAGGLNAKTVAQLRALAKERGVVVPAGARKADLVKALSEPTPSVPRLSKEELEAIRIYATPQVARELNESLTLGNTLGTFDLGPPRGRISLDELRRNLDLAIGKSVVDSDTTAWRGVRLDDQESLEFAAGAVVRDPGFLSVSLNESVARDFASRRSRRVDAKPYVLEIRIPAGYHAADGSSLISELILPRDTRLRVVSRSGNRIVTEAMSAAPLDEKALLRTAARERNRLIESSQGTAKLLAELDELISNKATKAAIRQRLDPALIAPEQVFAGADPAIVDALRKALDTGDPAKLRSAITRAGTKAKLKPVSKAGAKATFDAETMEGVGGIEIAPGAQVTVVRRGTTLTLPDGSTMQLTRAQVTPIAPKAAPVKAIKATKAAPVRAVDLQPITPFQALDMSDAQLRAAARARGIKLPRGATGDDAFAAIQRYQADLPRERVFGQTELRGPAALRAAPLDLDQPAGFRAALPPDQARRATEALTRYRTDVQGFQKRLNTGLREQGPADADVDAIRAAMEQSKLTSDVLVYRGSRLLDRAFGDLVRDDMTGVELVDPAFLSTATDRQIAAGFAGNGKGVLLRISVPKGTPGIRISGREGGAGFGEQGEGELLLGDGQRLRVVADHGVENIELVAGRPAQMARVLDVEVVPAATRPIKAVRVKAPTKAVARQSAIDEARQVGDLAAEVLELSNNGASVAALRSRITNAAARLGTPDEVRDALLELTSHTGDVLRAEALRQLEAAGITPIGTAGQVVKFDRKIHAPIPGVKTGDLVIVDRPGLTLTRDGEKIQLSKAKISAAPKPPTPVAPPGTSMVDREIALRRVAKAPVKGEPRFLGAGTQGEVKLVTTSEGEYVEKQLAGYIKKADLPKVRDAEELGPMVLEAFGLRGPASYAVGERGVISEFMEGKTGAELFPSGGYAWEREEAFQHLIDSDEGRLMGLADYLMGNVDRNRGNWLHQADGRIAGIDHGYAFQDPELRDVTLTPSGDFGEWLQQADRRHLTATVDVDPRDLAIVRARLEALRPRFTEASRSAWFNTMMSRLAELEKRAVGTTPRIAEAAAETLTRSLPSRQAETVRELMAAAKSGVGHEEIEARIARVVDGEFGGIRTRLSTDDSGITHHATSTQVRLTGELIDSSGRKIGTFTRRVEVDRHTGDLVAHQEYLGISSGHRGSGFAKEFNDNLMDWYRRSGVKRVYLYAGDEVGGYAWARAGYDFADHAAAEEFLDRALTKVREAVSAARPPRGMRKAQLADLQRYLEDMQAGRVPASVADVAQFGRGPDQAGRRATWPGKWLLLGGDAWWRGVLYL